MFRWALVRPRGISYHDDTATAGVRAEKVCRSTQGSVSQLEQGFSNTLLDLALTCARHYRYNAMERKEMHGTKTHTIVRSFSENVGNGGRQRATIHAACFREKGLREARERTHVS